MARLNRKTDPHSKTEKTHEGAPAIVPGTLQQLERSVMSCFLWEREFYEEGEDIATRIERLAAAVSPDDLAALAIKARHEGQLRHVPLLLLSVLAKTGSGRQDGLVARTIEQVISRADELSEFLAIYWRKGKTPLSGQVKKGLARAFSKFDAYQLGKYNRDGAIKLRDVLFLSHAKPKAGQLQTWGSLIDGTLESPDTWEVELSAGKDKKETFERLIRENKLGYMALLRNLRNMEQAGCDRALVQEAIRARRGAQRVLPFRYVTATRHAPSFTGALGDALLKSVSELPELPGITVVCVDTSGSMQGPVSQKSVLKRVDAAATLASMINGDVRLVQFASTAREISFFKGLAGIEFLDKSIGKVGHGTDINAAVQLANQIVGKRSVGEPARIIVITDEQSHTKVGAPIANRAYMINVASAKNGIGYGRWVHIDGFSESTLKFIHAYEADKSA